jgi:predicted dehydrogenase
VCGEIDEVRALVSNTTRGFKVEDTAAIALRFSNGALGTLTVSDAVPAPWSWELASGENPLYPRQEASCYFFSGTQGALSVPDMTLFSYGEKKGWYAPLAKRTIEVAREDPQARQLRHFCRVVRGEEAPRIDGADATRTLAVVEAIRKAAHF